MVPYLLYIVLTLVLAIRYDGREEGRHKHIWYAVTCVFLILIAGLRNGVGGDTLSYKKEFDDTLFLSYTGIAEYLRDNLFTHGRMPLWSMFMTGCRYLSDSFYLFQFIHATVVIVPFFYFFKKYTDCYFLCALLYGAAGYFFLFNTEVLRESIAIVCGIFAIQFFLKGGIKGYIGYAIFVIIGILFHVSAGVVLAFPFAQLIPIRKSTLILGVLTALVLWFAGDYIVAHLPSFILSRDSSLAQKVTNYAEMKSNFYGFIFNSLRYICLPYIVMYYSLRKGKDPHLNKHKEGFCAFTLIIGICAVGISGFARINNYTALFYIMALSEFIYLYIYSPRSYFLTRTVVLAGSLLCLGLFYTSYYPVSHRYHYEFYYPYTSLLDDEYIFNYRYDMHYESTFFDKSGKLSRTE